MDLGSVDHTLQSHGGKMSRRKLLAALGVAGASFIAAGGAVKLHAAGPKEKKAQDQEGPFVHSCDTIAELLSMNTALLTQGQAVLVDGTPFRWTGSVFEPLGRVSLLAFGADATGTQDSSQALLDAWNSGWPLGARPADRFLVSSMPQVQNKSIDFDGSGCTFVLDGDTHVIQAKASFMHVTAVSGIAPGTVNLSNGTTGDTEVSVLTVSNAAGYGKNDIVKIIADDPIPGETSSRKRAEYAIVAQVSGNQLMTYSRLAGQYSTNVRIAKMNTGLTFRFMNVQVEQNESPNPSWSTPAIRCIGYHAPVIGWAVFRNLLERAMLFVSCYKPKTLFADGQNIRTSQVDDAFGYLIHEMGCYAGYHLRPEARNVRHVYTCSAIGTADNSPFVENYGGTSGTTVDHGHGVNCTASAFDTHADGENITFSSCVAEAPYKGTIGALINYGLRGRNNRCVNCVSIGGNGYRAFSDFASADNSRGHEFVNCFHQFNGNETDNVRAFGVLGVSGGPVGDVRAVNPRVDQPAGVMPSFGAERGTLYVDNPYVRARQTGQSQGRVFDAVVGGTIHCQGGTVDYAGSTGTGLRTLRAVTDFSEIYASGLRIMAPSSGWALIADLGNGSGTVVATGLDITMVPGFNVLGVFVGSGSPNAYVDYVIQGGRNGRLGKVPAVTRSAPGALAVEFGRRGSPRIDYAVIALASGVDVSSAQAGYYEGQELVIRNHAGSEHPIHLENGSHLLVGAAVELAPGRAFRLQWDGSNWTPA